jgi:hypothetical protein
VPIPPASHDPKAIGHLLRQHGAPAECHVISTDGELDGRELPLDAVLGQIVGVGGGSLLSCIPGRLGYFEGESERYILSRGPAQGSRPNSGRTSRVER